MLGIRGGQRRLAAVAVVATIGVLAGMATVPASASVNPAAPTSVTAVAGDSGGVVDVSWTTPSDVTDVVGYVVQASDSSGAICTGDGCPGLIGSLVTSLAYQGLDDGTSYTFVVYSELSTGEYVASAPSNSATPFTYSEAPAAPTATRTGEGKITVTWSTPGNDGGSDVLYYVLRCDTGGCSESREVSSGYEVTGLDPTTSYTFTVEAVNGRGSAIPPIVSSPSNAVTPYGPATAPTSVSATTGDDAQSTVSWVAADGNGRDIVSYTVVPYLASDSGFTDPKTSLVKTVGADTLSTTITGLDNGTSYVFKVYAVTGSGEDALDGDYSDASSPVTPAAADVVGPPSAPGTPMAVAGDGEVTLTWTEPSDPGGTGQTIATYAASAVEDATKTCTTTAADSDPLTCTITGLANYQTYSFTVTATNLEGYESDPSTASGPVMPIAPGAAAPTPPTGLTVTIEADTATFHWSAVTATPSVASYVVTPFLEIGSDPPYDLAPLSIDAADTSTTLDLTGNPYGAKVGFRVVARNAVGDSDAAESQVVTYHISTLPDSWAECVDIADTMCFEPPVSSGTAEPVIGTSPMIMSLPSVDGPDSISWSLTADLESFAEQDITWVIRTGGWRPRYTTALVDGVAVTIAQDPDLGWLLTVSGRPLHIDWAGYGDPLWDTCTMGAVVIDCGDDTARATALGSGWRYTGNTQDLGGDGWAADRERLTGFYVTTDAQAGPYTSPLALTFWGVDTDPAGWQVVLGNPHLDVNGDPVRGYLRAWMPPGYFTALGTTADAAAAIGFSVTSQVQGGASEPIAATIDVVNGGVLVTIPDIGYSVRTLTVVNEPTGPDTPVLTLDSATDSSVEVSFTPQDGATYTYSYFATDLECDECGVLEEDVPIDVESGGGAFTIEGLPADAGIHVTVTATLGQQTATSDELVAYTLPTAPALFEGDLTNTDVIATFTAQDGVNYACEAYLDADPFDEDYGDTVACDLLIADGGDLGPVGTVTVEGLDPLTWVSVAVSASGLAQDNGQEQWPVWSDYLVTRSTATIPVLSLGTKTTTTGATGTVSWTFPDPGEAVTYRAVCTDSQLEYLDGCSLTKASKTYRLTVTAPVDSLVFASIKITVVGEGYESYWTEDVSTHTLPKKPVIAAVPASLTASSAVWTVTGLAEKDCDLVTGVATAGGSPVGASKVKCAVSGGTVRVTVEGQGAGVAISLKVRAIGVNNTEEYAESDANSQTTLAPPAKPVLTASTTTTSSVSATFPCVAGVAYTAAAKIGTKAVAAGQVATSCSVPTGRVTINGLAPNTSVSITVTATKSGLSAASTAITVKSKVAAPTVKSVTLAFKARVPTVTWVLGSDGGDADLTYTVVIKDSKGRVVATGANVTKTSWTRSALAKGTYTATVTAKNSAGTSAAVSSAAVKVT